MEKKATTKRSFFWRENVLTLKQNPLDRLEFLYSTLDYIWVGFGCKMPVYNINVHMKVYRFFLQFITQRWVCE